GGWIAEPMFSQVENRRVWSAFHANARHFLTRRNLGSATPRVMALVEAASSADVQVTLESLASTTVVDHVIGLDRQPISRMAPPPAGLSVRRIDLSVEEPIVLENELGRHTDEA